MSARPKTALITGVTGQDGGYLAELLLDKGYHVVGLADAGIVLHDDIELITADLSDADALADAVQRVVPDEIYNLAARSSVAASFDEPLETCDITGMGVVRLLNCIVRHAPSARLLQASSAEIFGSAEDTPQRETTAFRPSSPYGAAKLLAHTMVSCMRSARGLFACNAILFNHESARRGEHFVTRKITRAAARISLGLQSGLTLGNLDARRDWGYAPDYVAAMHLMLQADIPADYIVASGETHSLRELLALAFSRVGLEWSDHVTTDPTFVRPSDIAQLCGDPRRIEMELGWRRTRTFEEIINEMVDHDLELARAEVQQPATHPDSPG